MKETESVRTSGGQGEGRRRCLRKKQEEREDGGRPFSPGNPRKSLNPCRKKTLEMMKARALGGAELWTRMGAKALGTDTKETGPRNGGKIEEGLGKIDREHGM